MTAEHPNAALVRRAYAAQARGDLDTYLSLLADDFVLRIPGRSQIAGEYRGRDEMRRHFAEIAALSGGTFRTTVHDVTASDEHVIALVEATAERDGVAVELPASMSGACGTASSASCGSIPSTSRRSISTGGRQTLTAADWDRQRPKICSIRYGGVVSSWS
jgi:uncharacterized protein